MTRRILMKLSHPSGAKRPTVALTGTAGPPVSLKPLFDVTPAARTGMSLQDDAAREHRWYQAEVADGPAFDNGGDVNDWDLAHNLLAQQFAAGDARLLAAEPDIEQAWTATPPPGTGPAFAAATASCQSEPQKGPPLAPGPEFAWHLKKEFSQLKQARDAVMASGDDVVVVHLDTGFDPDEKALPQNLDRTRQRNFVDEGIPNDATDHAPNKGFLINRGHGTATLGILAGGKLTGMVPAGANTKDYLGGAPLAKVVPVRIANSVVHFWTSTVAQGIAYARDIKADVISMSMGGLPSGAWADAVNAAYEAGIVIVCAAGNNYGGLPTSETVWPARYQRVIGVCGVMADSRPYFNLPLNVMQGSFGPASKMSTAMAAFTPNIPWLKIDCGNVVDEDGAGTSCATPQVAAAAALWLRKYKSQLITKYPEPWMRGEAVRQALFASAKAGSKPDPFFGEGVLQANAALAVKPMDAKLLTKQTAAQGPFGFFSSSVGLGLEMDARRMELLRLELTQLVAASKDARDIIPDTGVPAAEVPETDRRRLLQLILDQGKSSRALRQYLETQLGRVSARTDDGAKLPPPPPPSATTPRRRGASRTPTPAQPVQPAGSELPRNARRRPPAVRRLQTFLVDPSLSNRLATAFINKAVVEVPWESSPANNNILQPGPVGEYIEVVDVDPASGAVYDPVDLNDPFLLAEEGLAPSESNPQFHQQMVYTVSMRTIAAFEKALGRKVLWAARRTATPTVDQNTGRRGTHYEELYVPRLRIYPHALRQANAYYSPDKVALLFGYFPERLPGGGGNRVGGMVFSCLSQDIVAHETTHAVLDGLHRRYQEPSNVDVLAFHEAFADLIAIFQHFKLPELLRFEIARTRGALRTGGIMADLARQFGEALGRSRALRSAVGVDPAEINYEHTTEAHERGSVLVAAVFDAFIAIYERRASDLIRLATGGTGVLAAGDIHPDLVARLADEAAKTAGHMLNICIRALDYCPPHDITFMDYLRALVTADADLVEVDRYGYRVAFLEAFRSRNICQGVRTLSVESLSWGSPARQPKNFVSILRQMNLALARSDRREAYQASKQNAATLHAWLASTVNLDEDLAVQFGLNRYVNGGSQAGQFELDENNRPRFEIHSVRPARRVSPDGELKTDIIVVITQRRRVPIDPGTPGAGTFWFRAGATLVIDAVKDDDPIRYSVVKSIWSTRREEAQRKFRSDAEGMSLYQLYFGGLSNRAEDEPFALVHIGQ